MNLEHLVNELLLDIFEYLKSVHLLQAFSHLNSRFNNLVVIHFRTHGLDLQSISKHDFDTICQQNLPLIADRISGLRLSDDDDTPNQIDLFLSHSFIVNRFVQLKSLSLYHISSNEIMKKVVLQIRHHPLTHFSLINCHLTFHQKTLRDVLNRIWHLPKLTHCHLDLHFRSTSEFSIPTIRSKSIEHLCIENISLNSNQLSRLFRCTPNLQHLTASINKLSNNTQFPYVIQSITSLKLAVDHLTQGTINLLKKMPNLTVLTLQTGKHNMNGHRWKQFIVDYMPKLKTFRFLMFFYVNNEEEIEEILDSYRTPFWLIDHQWFTRCHWELDNNKILIYFYTLPYAFSFYSYIFKSSNVRTKSTCPRDDDYWSYNRVTTLIQHYSTLHDLFLSHIRFHNIRHLEMNLPVSDQFLSVLSRLDQLTSLSVSSDADIDDDIVLSQLQTLINRAPRLYSLTIADWRSSIIQHLPLYLTSNSIRRLDLQSHHYLKRDRCFNSEQCVAFLRSPLAKQCEVLQIVVDNRLNIDNLINGMANIQALKVVLQLGQWDNHFPSQEEFITWMVSGYSRTFTENLTGTETIRLWIHK
ncbi:unnamed protein product [Rotaria socialis]|uniref:F-box domain-containing protein n=1 Tax=Rotaria socialis TaxID=392032 RepID=A0A818CPW9_9BILA|nr:unnamed protein product [Rotaria socialis]CAF3282517.1 unnamed protein product [Rotaria socialis]CAF3435315.1 unnamed protein product [Rotaria socialis]CAF3615617.1 unnamed protein product [Rotaria socialis]CAF4272733.1 unnamed protein product [Rotaria socialis]